MTRPTAISDRAQIAARDRPKPPLSDRALAALVRRLRLTRWHANQRTGRVWAKRGGVWGRVDASARPRAGKGP